MTARPAKLQALMAEIEALLGKANPRLPWGLAGETGQQRRVLEDTYQYLKTLQGNASGPSSWDGIDPATGEIVPGDVGPGFEGNAEASSQQILQALLQEMQYLRSQTLQPLRTEVMALQQQREQLLNEVRQLEQQRLQGTAQPVAQALPPSLVDELVERLREALLHQLRPQIQSPQGSAQHPAALYGNAEFPALEDGSDLPQLHPQQRLDQLRHIQAQTDYLLLKLDTNLRAVFESMEQSIQSYRDSLHQGLDTMHGLGQQGEVIFKTLVNHLAQQLGQEQATYLDAAATAIPSQSHLVANATTANVLESTESALADLEDWDDIETSSFAAQTDAAAEVEFPEDLPFSIDLDDLDLGEPLAEDEDITLFQLDEAITKLQLDDNDDAIQGNEETLVQREPLPWPGIPDTAHADPEGGSDPVEAEDGVAVHTELDALYESLFGEPDASPNPSDNADIDPESLLPESPLDQALFETHTDLDFALEVEPATAESLDDLASSEPVLEDPVSSFEDAEATHFDTINQDSSLEAEGNLAIADLDFEAFDQALGLFERPAEIEAPASDLNAAPTLSDLLGSDESPDPQPTNAGEASLETHTIASLAELLPAASEAATPLFEGLSPDLEMDEDSFIPAPSDEDLLSNPPGATPWDPELKLTADALDQLSVDLLNLEDGSANPPIEAAETVEPVPSVETQSSSSEPLTAEATEVAATEVEPPAPLREHAGSFESDQVDSAAYLDREVAAVAPDENWDDFNLDTLIPDRSPPADHPLDADLNLAPDDLSLQDLSLDLDWIEPEAPAPTDENDPGISDDTDEPLGDDLSGDLGDQSVENDWTLEALPIFEAPPAIVDSANAATENPENAADLDENISDLLAAWTADPARDEPSLDPRDADATTENPETAADQDISDLLAAWTADPDRPSADAPRNEPSLDPRDADATTENPENSADQDISDLLAAWTADPDRPSTDESRDERQSTSLGGFADEVLSEPMGTEPANPELPWLGEEGFSLSLEDISFDLDLPSLAKNYIGGEAVSPATPDQPAPDQPAPEPIDSLEPSALDDDLSLATFESELGQAVTASGAESDSLERFSLGDLDLNLNLDLDLESDLSFEPPPTIDDDFFGNQAEAEAPGHEVTESDQGDPSTITTLESLNDGDLFASSDGSESNIVDPRRADQDNPSKITTLESLSDLALSVPAQEPEPTTGPQIEDDIDLFGDQGETAPAERSVINEATATIPLSLDSLDLFSSDGDALVQDDSGESASLTLDALELFSDEITLEETDRLNLPDPGPIDLFSSDEGVPEGGPDLDLADPGLLDLFPPLAPEPLPVISDNLFNDEGNRDLASSQGSEAAADAALETSGETSEETGPALTLEALLALDGPEPTLPEGLEVDSESEIESSEPSEPRSERIYGLDSGSETAPLDLSLDALGLAQDDTDILSSLQSENLATVGLAIAPSPQPVASGQIEPVPAHPQDPPEEAPPDPDQDWFLGIDFGTTGISAVLMNRFDGQAYPLYWTDAGIASTTAETLFRLPTVALFNGVDGTAVDGMASDWTLGATGPSALTLNWQGESTGQTHLATQMKAWLAVGVAYQDGQGNSQPRLKWSDHDTLPIQQAMAATEALLSTLRQLKTADVSYPAAPMGAAGLDGIPLQRALQQLQGVIVGHSTMASDTYRINLREVILATQLVSSASQVLFVEEAIATVLSGLPDPGIPLEPQGNQTQTLYQCQWQGGTVIINSGAGSTDLGIVNLPNPLSALSREDFTLRSLAYGGDALDLDVISQLLIPADRRQTRSTGSSRSPQGTGWDWQAASPDVQNSRWETLELETLDLPRLAEPDVAARIRLRQKLESSPLGQSLLEAARHGKLILQNQAQFHLELGDQSWRVLRRDLESRILVPYIQRINQHLNALMSETGLSSQGIHQVICTGGNASFATIARWLRQKFPNATIIQDTYPSNRPPSCSRVAYGLVNLCRYPQVLDGPRHQYSDYFLLQEILKVIPNQPMPLQGILHLLDQQGVNTEVCHRRILALLEGHLPPGLVPDMAGRSHLSAASLGSEPYRALMTDVLFTRQSGQIYAPNLDACQRMEAHLNTLMAGKQQSLAEPLLAQLVTV